MGLRQFATGVLLHDTLLQNFCYEKYLLLGLFATNHFATLHFCYKYNLATRNDCYRIREKQNSVYFNVSVFTFTLEQEMEEPKVGRRHFS